MSDFLSRAIATLDFKLFVSNFPKRLPVDLTRVPLSQWSIRAKWWSISGVATKIEKKQIPGLIDTLINVFSTTKAITATCFLQLVERGKVDLGALVGDYWPEYACNGKEKPESVIFYATERPCTAFREEYPNSIIVRGKWTERSRNSNPSESREPLRVITH